MKPDTVIQQDVRLYSALLNDGHVQDLPGFTHGMLDTRTPDVAALLRRFLARES